jgi:hypothetical protein
MSNFFCTASDAGDEIIIDHSTPGDSELKDVKVGERVYALFWKGKKEGTVHTCKGIRGGRERGGARLLRGRRVTSPAGPSEALVRNYWPNLFLYSSDEMKALTISAALKSPLKLLSLFSQKLKPGSSGLRRR